MNILITGRAGTGKTSLAKALTNNISEQNKVFVSGLSGGLVELNEFIANAPYKKLEDIKAIVVDDINPELIDEVINKMTELYGSLGMRRIDLIFCTQEKYRYKTYPYKLIKIEDSCNL